jgi:hypothetical protein
MLDISVSAWRAKWGDRQDSYAPLEDGPAQPVKLAGQALLSDAQNSLLGGFIVAHLPRSQHTAFRQSVLSRLSWGKPGDGAFKQSMRLAAMEIGFTMERLSACGLCNLQDRPDTSRRGRAEPSRRQIRKGKFD